MPDSRREWGTDIEKAIAVHLEGQGYTILAHQYQTPYGEIDLVCRDGDEIVFVEVKARRSRAFGYPEESVTTRKLGHLVKSAQSYLQRLDADQAWRIDVIAVEAGTSFGIEHIKAVDIPNRF
ncbi:YraN family protein [Candidatus Uhrbacteria bacterium]|nr:YraN family protein [Candidatus Uhrbacteria bacterium]